jgi:hypothetical protein
VASGRTSVRDCVSNAKFPIPVLVTSLFDGRWRRKIDHVPFSYGIVRVSEGTPELMAMAMHDIGLYGTNIGWSQKWAYLHSLSYPFFAPCLVYVRHKFDRRWAR